MYTTGSAVELLISGMVKEVVASPAAKEATTALSVLLKDKNKDVRANAAEALKKIEGKAQQKKD